MADELSTGADSLSLGEEAAGGKGAEGAPSRVLRAPDRVLLHHVSLAA